MSYSLLQKEAAAIDFDGDFDTEMCTKESQEGKCRDHRPAARLGLGSIFGVLLVIIAILCVLLIVDIIIRFRYNPSGNPWNIQSTYGSNFDYMSLDHKFDYLWDDELVGNNGVIRLSSEMESNSQNERGAIGMFVSTIFSLILTSAKRVRFHATASTAASTDNCGAEEARRSISIDISVISPSRAIFVDLLK